MEVQRDFTGALWDFFLFTGVFGGSMGFYRVLWGLWSCLGFMVVSLVWGVRA